MLCRLLPDNNIGCVVSVFSRLGAGIFKNLATIQQLFGQRPALNSGKYLEAEKQYQVWDYLVD